jgi:polyphosphate glucokinase
MKTADHKQEANETASKKILVVDIGGSKVKLLRTGTVEPQKFRSGKSLTPVKLVQEVKKLISDEDYDFVSIGYPGLVGPQGPRSEPGNLGSGWVGFDFSTAFQRPVRIINDAAMQALGSYEGGRMLYLGLGTGLGATFIADNILLPLELGQLFYQGHQRLGELLGDEGLQRLGKNSWRNIVKRAVVCLMDVFQADYVVLGGGNARRLKKLPPGARRGHNLTVFRGGFHLWSLPDVPTLSEPSSQGSVSSPNTSPKLI